MGQAKMIRSYIINADDFGMRNSINVAIVECIETGTVSSATIMVARDPSAAREAIEFARRYRGRAGFGLHLDLDGFFDFDGTGHYGTNEDDGPAGMEETARRLEKDIAAEVRSQVRALRAAGISPSHLDGHHNVHLFPCVLAGIVIPALVEEGVTAVRFDGRFYRDEERASAARDALRGAGIAFPSALADLGAIMNDSRWSPGSGGEGHIEIMAHLEMPCPGAESWRVAQYRFLHETGTPAGIEPVSFRECRGS